MVQYHPEVLNRNIAPGIAEFATAEIPDLRSQFPDSEHWLTQHFLSTLFGPTYKGRFRQHFATLLARAQAQFALYHAARDITLDYLGSSKPHSPAIRKYYQAVFLWESCFVNLQMFVDSFTKSTGSRAFAKGDGSQDQRAYDVANAIKHWAG